MGIFILRRVIGESMTPTCVPGTFVLGWCLTPRIKLGDVIIVKHNGQEKIKRVGVLNSDKVYVIGDNLRASTDSRHFGWIDRSHVIAKVIWPRSKQKSFGL